MALVFDTLTNAELVTATGGTTTPAVTDPTTCTAANPSGARVYNQSLTMPRSGPSVAERVNQAYDRAMAPWQTFNGLFGGLAGGGGAAPPIARPSIR